MGSERLNNVIEFIRVEREKIWLNEPADIDRVKHRMGAKGQSLTVIFFANREVSAIARSLFGFRELALSDDPADLGTLKRVTLQLLHRASVMFGQIIYNMIDAQRIYSRTMEVLPEANTRQEHCALIEELIHYSVRLEQWTDWAIPWKPLSDLFMASLKCGESMSDNMADTIVIRAGIAGSSTAFRSASGRAAATYCWIVD